MSSNLRFYEMKNTQPVDIHKLPLLDRDVQEEIVGILRRFDPGFSKKELRRIQDYPAGDDFEFLLQLYYGGAGPFIELMGEMDAGVGWTYVPRGFESEDDGADAVAEAVEFTNRIELFDTMQRWSHYYEGLGRAFTVETFNVDEGYYYSPQEKCYGVDCISPLTLDMESVRQAVYDRTGIKPFIQRNPKYILDSEPESVVLDQVRCTYSIRGTLAKYGVLGNSAMANCLPDLRALGSAPHLRLKMMQKYAKDYKHYVLDVEELRKTPMGEQILSDWDKSKEKLAESKNLVRKQEREDESLITYSFIKPAEITSYRGKGGDDMSSAERMTLESISFRMGIPLPLANMNLKDVNRSTLETVADACIKQREMKGGRKKIRPFVERVMLRHIRSQGIEEGWLQMKYNPFLPKDVLAAINRILALIGVDAASNTELRRAADMPDQIDFGDEESADHKPRNSVNTEQQNKIARIQSMLKNGNIISL